MSRLNRSNFVDALIRLGACPEGLAAAETEKGHVQTIANRWASAHGNSAKYRFFNWLSWMDDYEFSYFGVEVEMRPKIKRVVAKAKKFAKSRGKRFDRQ